MSPSANTDSLAWRIAAPLRDNGQPCAQDCAYAQTIRSDPFGESWLWCTHPANTTRVVSPGRSCPRYAAGPDWRRR